MKAKLPIQVEDSRLGGRCGWHNGACVLGFGNARLKIIFSDGYGWDHVSVSLATRTPTWREMCFVKKTFFRDDEVVMQLHPAESDYVDYHLFCLHLWRPQTAEEMAALREEWTDEWDDSWESPGVIPLPNTVLIGPKSSRRGHGRLTEIAERNPNRD